MKIIITESQLNRLLEGKGTIDRVLDKINVVGMKGLNSADMRILDDYSKGIKDRPAEEQMDYFLNENFNNLGIELAKENEDGSTSETKDEDEAKFIILFNDLNNIFFYEIDKRVLNVEVSTLLNPVSEIYMTVNDTDTLSDSDLSTINEIIMNWFLNTYMDKINSMYVKVKINPNRMDLKPFYDY